MKKRTSMLAGILSIMSLAFMGFWLPPNEKQEQSDMVEQKPHPYPHNFLYLAAVRQGDLGRVKKALHEGADINAVDENHYSALHLLALRRRPNYQKYAISPGNEIFFEGAEGKWESVDSVKAQEQKFYYILNFLLEAGIDTLIQDNQGLIAQDLAAQNNDYVMVRCIIDAEKAKKEIHDKGK